jgi:hypothetical protein
LRRRKKEIEKQQKSRKVFKGSGNSRESGREKERTRYR